MMRPLTHDDLIKFDTEPEKPPKLKKMKRNKIKSWASYKRWWNGTKYFEIWWSQ